MAGKVNFAGQLNNKSQSVKGVKLVTYILQLLLQNSATFNTLCNTKTVIYCITEDYFFFVSSDLPADPEMDSLISVSAWMFLNL